MEYKNTIITPKTDFPMKAGLPAREPGMLARWEEQDLYNAMLEKNKDLPPFILHDGPPFSTTGSSFFLYIFSIIIGTAIITFGFTCWNASIITLGVGSLVRKWT